MQEGTISTADGRTLGYVDYGPSDGAAVLWFHGGPGSRLEPKTVAAEAAAHGFRVVGSDRPGYGLSTPWPGRTIAGLVPDTLALADHLGIDHFYAVGVSTGGAYALATAALAPERVLGVVACCALTDLRNAEIKRQLVAMTDWSKIFAATSRDEALALAVGQFGEDGSKLMARAGLDAQNISLAPRDEKLFADAAYLMSLVDTLPPMFAWGVQGYADDRLADGPGWGSFDVRAIRCPVVVLHGESDTICPVINAHNTAAIVPGAQLQLMPDDGHFSIVAHVPAVLAGMAR